MNTIELIINHAELDVISGGISERGRLQAEEASEVIKHLLGRSALVLSSDMPTALGTAEIITERLELPLVASPRIYICGTSPDVIIDLDAYFQKTIEEQGENYDPSRPLVVVTHAPLVAAVKGLSPLDAPFIEYCEIVPYKPGTWYPPTL